LIREPVAGNFQRAVTLAACRWFSGVNAAPPRGGNWRLMQQGPRALPSTSSNCKAAIVPSNVADADDFVLSLK